MSESVARRVVLFLVLASLAAGCFGRAPAPESAPAAVPEDEASSPSASPAPAASPTPPPTATPTPTATPPSSAPPPSTPQSTQPDPAADEPAPATPSPSPAPRPPPRATPSVVVESSALRLADAPSVEVLGEVVNGGTAAASYASVRVTLLAEDGSVLHEEDVSPFASTLQPGERSPFRLTASVPGAVAHRATATAIASEGEAAGALAVDGVNVTEGLATFVVKGKVRNTGDSTAHGVRAAIAVRNATGVLVLVDEAYASPESLLPGESASFAFSFRKSRAGESPSVTAFAAAIRFS